MPDLATLYSYEAQFEPALAQILGDRGLNAFVEFSAETKETPFVDVSMVHVAATGHQHLVPNSVQNGIGILYYDAWTAECLCRVWTQRGINSEQQAPILGIIRAAVADFQTLFNRAVLPYHDLERFRESKESSLARGYDSTLNLDWSEIRFDLTFSIRTDMWDV